jgi:N-acetylglucosaminyl-diphospho-decaprenol L-rhamnosyltransferase
MITVSIVSHGHGTMIAALVTQLLDFEDIDKIVLILNIPETLDLPANDRIEILRNASPRGFGANHNAAFRHCTSDYFLVLNPDIVFLNDPFPTLVSTLRDTGAAVVAPLITTSEGKVEDSMRQFPTILSLFSKALKLHDGRYHVSFGQANIAPDWIGGMFMLFQAIDFRAIGGFDEAYFLYYEDVDICARLWRQERQIVACTGERVIHTAQRASHKSWRFRRWHAESAMRYLLRHSWRQPRRKAG